MTGEKRRALLEEEVLILRHSGEIPEIALHSSFHYLEEDEEGPNIRLEKEERELLCQAALSRAREIVLRDLDPANRGRSIYRGPARSIVNWQRLENFCRRINRDCPGFKEEVARALLRFLEKELEDVRQGKVTVVNCTTGELESFCRKLHLDPECLPPGWDCLCLKE
ncbi:MAG: hypothetical protein Kow0089_04050 [Desulfobulbaceae bacterium]